MPFGLASAISGALRNPAGPAVVVELFKPTNSVLPAISGTTTLGGTLTCGTGTWSASPNTITYAYQWQRYTAGAWTNIATATASTYVTANDGAHRCQVIASNSQGASDPVFSGQITIGTSQVAPSVVQAPQISGNAYAGSTIHCLPGLWSGSGTITYAYQWQVQDANTLAWGNISGANTASYTTPSAANYRCLVTASNDGGPVSIESNRMIVSAPGALMLPDLDYAPRIIGTPTVNATLTSTRAVWFANPEPTYAYLWQVWNGSTWVTASGTTNLATYTPTANGDYRCRVTATNSQGSASGNSPLVTVSGASTAGTYTQAQVIFDEAHGGIEPMVATLEFRATTGGAKLAGTAFASSEAGSLSAATAAFDTSTDTYWQPAYDESATPILGQIFSAATAIEQVSITFANIESSAIAGAPHSFRIQGWNGTAWTTIKTVTNEPQWAPGESRLYGITQGATATVPGAPTIGTVTAGDGFATVPYTAPASDGGSAIIDYRITASTGQVLTGVTSSPATITMPNGTAATFTAAARNDVGYGPESAASNSVTPAAPIVAPVVIGTATTATSTTSPLSIPIPSGTQQDDFIMVLGRNSAAEVIGVSGVTNMTALWTVSKTTPANMRMYCRLYRRNSATAPTLGLSTATPANGFYGAAIAFRGLAAVQTNPEFDGYRTSDANGTDPSFVNVVTTNGYRMVLAISFIGDDLTPAAVASGWTRLVSLVSPTGLGGSIIVDAKLSGASAETVVLPDHYGTLGVAWAGLSLGLQP